MCLGRIAGWSAVTPPANCTVSYTITGGPLQVSTSNTTDTLSELSPSTSYTFSVAATDNAGTGPASTVTVTTTNAPANGYFVGGGLGSGAHITPTRTWPICKTAES